MSKPFSQSCENNKKPIINVIRKVFSRPVRVLEIGSGTGQHAVYFAAELPHLDWYTSDLADNHPGINAWIDEAKLKNLYRPVVLDVCQENWPCDTLGGVFSANTAHIMSWKEVKCMFKGIGRVLQSGGAFCLYGPFNYEGRFTSASNAEFDTWLKSQAAHRGIRDFEALNELAGDFGMLPDGDHAMPANNRTLVWRKS